MKLKFITIIPVRISKFHASPEMLISDKQPPRAPPPWKLLITLVLQYYSIYKDFLKQNLSHTEINETGHKGNLLHPLQKDHFFKKKKTLVWLPLTLMYFVGPCFWGQSCGRDIEIPCMDVAWTQLLSVTTKLLHKNLSGSRLKFSA